jgi:RimJ/RimL family protein N-acetyltransferase
LEPSGILIDCGFCLLRPWREDDLDALVRHADDKDVARMLRDHFPHPYTVDAGRAWLLMAAIDDPPTALAIEVNGEAVGGIGLVPGADVHRHTGTIGYWLGRAFWGRGIATAAVSHFVPWAASTFGLVRFVAEVFATNPASMRVLEKCGFEREGVFRAHVYKDGHLIDEAIYGRILDGPPGPTPPRPPDTNAVPSS